MNPLRSLTRPAPRRDDARRLLAIIAHGRTGTHHLRALLNTHPGVYCFSEILNPNLSNASFYAAWARAVADDPSAILVPHRLPDLFRAFLDDLVARRAETVIGVDVKIPQIGELPALYPVLDEVDLLVHLVRRNTLRAVVSELIMLERIRAGDPEVHRRHTPDPIRVRVDPADVLARLRYRTERDQWVAARYAHLGRRFRRLEYESIEHARDAPRAVAPILRDLGLRPADATFESHLARQNPFPLADLVDNLPDLRRALAGTPFEPQLDA